MNLARQAYRVNVEPDRKKHYPDLMLTKKAAIFEAIRLGNYLSVAASHGGISALTLQLWLRRGMAAQEAMEAGDEVHPYDVEYANFYSEFQQAEAAAEIELVRRVQLHTETQWVAAMTMLERRFPERWRRRETTEHIIQPGSENPDEEDDRALGSEDRLREVLGILQQHNLLPAALSPPARELSGASEVIDAEAQQVHPPQTESETTGSPPPPAP